MVMVMVMRKKLRSQHQSKLFYVNSYLTASECVMMKMKGNPAEDRKVRALTRDIRSGTVMCHCQKSDIVTLFFTRPSLLGGRKRICLGTVVGATLISHESVQNVPEGSASLPKHSCQNLTHRSKTKGFLFQVL